MGYRAAGGIERGKIRNEIYNVMGWGSTETPRDERAGEEGHMLLEAQVGQEKTVLATAGHPRSEQVRVVPIPEQ